MEERMENYQKSNKGITLIALIITVIVMLILAFTTMNLLIGENGILKKSSEGTEIYKNSAKDEATSLNEVEEQMGDLINKIEGKPRLIINLINYNQNQKIQADCAIEVYTDKACQNLLKTITIEKENYTQERCYETYDVPEQGTYYLVVKSVPQNFVKLNEVYTRTITKEQNNIWEIAFVEEDISNESGPFDRDYAMSFTFTYPSGVEDGLEIPVKVYKIGEYDEEYDKIIYDVKLENLGLKDLSVLDIKNTWMQKQSDIANKIEEMVKTNGLEATTEVRITQSQNGVMGGLDSYGVYFIDLEDVYSLEYHYSCRALLYTHYPEYKITGNKDVLFDLAMYKESIYDRERLEGEIRINSVVSDYSPEKGAVTAIYEVQATTSEGQVLCLDILRTTYDREGTGYTIVEKVPAGANVTATVKYVSPSYALTGDDTQFEISNWNEQRELNFSFARDYIKSTGWGFLEMQMEYDNQKTKWNFKNIKNEINKNMKINYKEEHEQKSVEVINTVAEECFIRLKILAPSDVNIQFMQDVENWDTDGEYWYYQTVLGSNKTIQVPLEIDNNNQEGRKIGNVIIVVERTQVVRDLDGNPTANWNELEEE